MQLALIRHLPTEWNKKGVLQGSRNIPLAPLTNEDKKNILKNQQKIEKIQPVDLVLTSSLIRTQQTAKFYGFDHNQIKIEPLLDELDFGLFEGKERKQLLETYSEWITNPRELVLGESLLEFERRVFSFLIKYHNVSKILVFGHGSWIRAMISIFQSDSIEKMNQIEVRNNDLYFLEMP